MGTGVRRDRDLHALVVLYWMHRARRDLRVQVPRHYGTPRHVCVALARSTEPDRDEYCPASSEPTVD